MRVISLFSGIGGIDLGFKQAGFEIVWANEFDKDAATTYKLNLGKDHLHVGDIRDVNVNDIPDFDVLVAGFPCQPFSIAGRQKGFDDERGNLFFEITRIIDAKRPKCVFLENVPNLIEHDNGKTFLVIFNSLAQFGYSVRYQILDSSKYGNVPQTRKRIFIVAFLDDYDSFAFDFPKEIELSVSLNDIIKRNEKHDDMYYYNATSVYFEDLKKRVTNKKAIYKIYDGGVGKKANYICPTLTANMGTYPDRVPIVLDDYGIRKITPYECLALQGFPSDYRFAGIPIASAYKQCGNSVVVPVIRRIAEEIAKVLNS